MQRGRPNRIQGLWNLINNLTNRGGKAELVGSQDPLAQTRVGITQRQRFNLEIPEFPVREPEIARQLIEMRHHSYEVRHSVAIAKRDTFLSIDGDDQGWSVSDTLADKTNVNPRTKEICDDVIARYKGKERVIGGRRLQRALGLALHYGDCFMEFGIEKEGLGTKDYGISETLYLPTWEIFAVEDQYGRVMGYAQCSRMYSREELMDKEKRQKLIDSGLIRWFETAQIVHFMHDEQTIYGQAAFHQSRPHWENIKETIADKREALRVLGVMPNIHVMPPGKDVKYLQAYQSRYRSMLEDGIVTDLFTLNGGDVRKMIGVNSNFDGFFREILDLRYHLIPAGFPVWMFPGLGTEMRTSREIAREPTRAYARMRYEWCAMLTEGIKWFLDVEIILKMGFDWWLQNGKYRIVWPKFTDHMNLEEAQIEDLEDNEDNQVDDLDDDGKPAPASKPAEPTNKSKRGIILL